MSASIRALQRVPAERRLTALYAVSRVLAEAETLDKVAPHLLQAIGEGFDWELGQLWIVDHPAAVIRHHAAWSTCSLAAQDFIARNRHMTFTPGLGVLGRVWQSGEPTWVRDFAHDTSLPRAGLAAEHGLNSAFAFPVSGEHGVLAVIEFFSHRIQRPDSVLLQSVSTLGNQISQFMEKKVAEERTRELAALLDVADSKITSEPESILRLNLLGVPQGFLHGHPIVFPTRKTLALLAYLALERGPYPREQLADLFWPDADAVDARASLRTTLSYVRRALQADADTLLTTTRELIGMRASAPVEMDVQALSAALRLTRQAKRLATQRLPLETAVERYRGEFLSGISLPDAPEFEAWLEAQRTHWRGVESELLDRLATVQIHDGDLCPALTTLERSISVDPDDESAWTRLIETQLQLQDRAGARRTWMAYRETVADLDAQPGAAIRALAQRIDEPAASVQSPQPQPAADRYDFNFHRMPLVGRSREQTLLFAALERSRTGRAEIVILEGEAGMGKTRLTDQFCHSAKSTGADVVTGRAFETVDELPYAPLTHALRTRLDQENAPEDLLGDIWLAELSLLVPDLRERYPDLPAPIDDPSLARGRLFEAVARFGQALAQRRPLVVILDDAQWIDGSTRDLVRYVIRRWTESGTSALVILTVRSECLGSGRDLAQWLSALQRDTSTLRLELDPLQSGDVVRLMGMLSDTLSRSNNAEGSRGAAAARTANFAAWLANRTGGKPFYLVQALEILLEHGVLGPREEGDGRRAIAPPDRIDKALDERLVALLLERVQSNISARLSRLGEVEEELLSAAALLKGQVTDQRLLQVASVEEDAALRGLDVLVRERLLCEAEDDGAYVFTDDLLREAVFAEAGRVRQRAYQRRATAVAEQHDR
jgi:DNA-binding SARP family transcriptional activator